MANKYYSLDTTDYTRWIASFTNALIDKYGDSLIVHNQTATELVFSCSLISEKVIKFNDAYCYCGTVSGTTFTSDATIIYAQGGFKYNKHLVLGDSFLFLTGAYTISYMNVLLIAKTVGGISIHYGGNTNSNYNGYYNSFCCRDGIDVGYFDIVSFGRSVFCDTATPYKTPLMLINCSSQGDYIVRKTDGTPDTIKDLYMSMYAISDDAFLKTGALFSATNVYQKDSKQHLQTALLAEF